GRRRTGYSTGARSAGVTTAGRSACSCHRGLSDQLNTLQGAGRVTQASIERDIATLLNEVKHIREDFRESQHKSDESRKVMHQRMDSLVDRVGKVEGKL